MLLLHFFIQPIAPKIFFSLSCCDATEQEQGDEVRNSHEGIHGVGDVPDDVKTDDGAKEQRHNIENTVEAIGTSCLDIVHSTLAIIAPAQDGAEGEGEDAKAA